MSVQAVLFDLDGTLLDTLADLALSVNEFLAQNHFPPRSLEEVRAFTGNGAAELLQCSLPERVPEEKLQEYLAQYKTIYTKNLTRQTKAYPGIKELLQKLKDAGIRTGVISNKPDWATRELAQEAFGDLIDLAIGDMPGKLERKPNPEPLEYVMKELHVDPEKTLYVGDSEVDIHTARNTGLEEIAVSWGFRSRKELEREHPDHIADTPDELWALIEERQ